ncbi:MAG: tetratricopeptide repeat protein [Methanothrix sp.]
MDQLVVLQEIYASFSKGTDSLKKIDIIAIEGCCSELVGGLLESSIKGHIDERICRELSLKLNDVYEMKRLGDICRRAGHLHLAVDAYRRALSLCQDPVLTPVLQNNLGQVYAALGEIKNASINYQKAADAFARDGDRIGLAHVLGNMGSAYRQSKDWNLAIAHCHKSLKTFEEEGDLLGIAQMTGSIGRIYADMGEYDLATRYFERSLGDFRRLGDKRGAAWILDRLGGIAGERGEWDKALGYLHSSISIWEEMGERPSLGMVLGNLGRTLLKMGEASAARDPLERAALLIPAHFKSGYQNAILSLGVAYSRLGEDAQNEALEDEAKGISRQDKRREASRLFAEAADRYHELASMRSLEKSELEARAALAKSRAYLSRIYLETSEGEAVLLAEKALAALDKAASGFDYGKRSGVLVLQRIVSGMIEAYRTADLNDEPADQRAALIGSAQHLLGATTSLSSKEAGVFLHQALSSISSAIEAQGAGGDVSKSRQAAASALEKAGEYYKNAEKEEGGASSKMIERAAQILKGSAATADISASREAAGARAKEAEMRGQRERAAILAIAGAMMLHTFHKLEKNDEMLKLDDSKPTSPQGEQIDNPDMIRDDALKDDLQKMPAMQTAARSDLPEREAPMQCKERELILADGSMQSSDAEFRSLEHSRYSREAPLNYDAASRGFGPDGLLLSEEREPRQRTLFRAEPSAEADRKQEEEFDLGEEKPGFRLERERETEEEIPSVQFPRQGTRSPSYVDQLPGAGLDDSSEQLHLASDGLENEGDSQKPSPIPPNAVFLLKLLIVLVLMLLSIEAVLYLI